MATVNFPPLPEVKIEDARHLEVPTLRIRMEEDVDIWKSTRGYQNYLLFLHRLSESVVGCNLPKRAEEYDNTSAAVRSMLNLLDKLDSWMDEIPPLPTPQRFGNLAFRSWGKRLEDNADDLMKSLLPIHMHGCIHLLIPYFVISFGSFTRMDYGTGHEAAFSLLLLCLSLTRFFEPEPTEERNLVLVVFYRYLRLCWRLQDVYRLEPAGSHGVWGLDDYSFLGYIFGSAQLRDQRMIPVSVVLRPPLPPTNLYFLSISRIHEVKKGPFHEHSSQLYAIATGVPNWGKVHSGLFKMYEAEVLGKRVVVQHIPAGGLLEWDSIKLSTSPVPTDTLGKPVQSTSTWTPLTTSGNLVPNLPPTRTVAPWTSASLESGKHSSTTSPAPLATRVTWTTSNSGTTRPDWEHHVTQSSMPKRGFQVTPNVDQSDRPLNSSDGSVQR